MKWAVSTYQRRRVECAHISDVESNACTICTTHIAHTFMMTTDSSSSSMLSERARSSRLRRSKTERYPSPLHSQMSKNVSGQARGKYCNKNTRTRTVHTHTWRHIPRGKQSASILAVRHVRNEIFVFHVLAYHFLWCTHIPDAHHAILVAARNERLVQCEQSADGRRVGIRAEIHVRSADNVSRSNDTILSRREEGLSIARELQ